MQQIGVIFVDRELDVEFGSIRDQLVHNFAIQFGEDLRRIFILDEAVDSLTKDKCT